MTDKITITPDPSETIGTFHGKLRSVFLKGMTKGMFALHEKIPGPPTPSRKPFQFVSIRQRRWFFYQLKSGGLQIPYKRTNEMLRRMTTTTKFSEYDKIVGIIGTSLPYAPWVISDRKIPDKRGPQSQYHNGTWWTLQDEVKKNLGVVKAAVKKAMSVL